MLEFKAKTKKWGNSVGVIIPKELGMAPGKEVRIHIEPPKKITTVGDIFGTFKTNKPAEQISKEVDKELDWG